MARAIDDEQPVVYCGANLIRRAAERQHALRKRVATREVEYRVKEKPVPVGQQLLRAAETG